MMKIQIERIILHIKKQGQVLQKIEFHYVQIMIILIQGLIQWKKI